MMLTTNYIETRSGLLIPENAQKSKPTAFDFFAGCGGFSLGFIQAGYEVVGALEWDNGAAWTYMANLGCYPMNMHFTNDRFKEKFNDFLEKHIFKSKKSKEILEGNSILTSEQIDISFLDGLPGSGWINSQRLSGNYFEPVKNFWLGDIREVKGKDIQIVLILSEINIEEHYKLLPNDDFYFAIGQTIELWECLE